MKYVIGVDAGGTKTYAVSFDKNKNKLSSSLTKSGNVSVEFNAAVDNIILAIDECQKNTGGECTFICVGIAGVETGDFKNQITKILTNRYNAKISVVNDAILSIYAGLKGNDGILLIAGTGAIAYSKSADTFNRVGGWGHLINDDGGAYSLVIKAVRMIMDDIDSKKPNSLLTNTLFNALHITHEKELIHFIYNSDKSKIASLFPFIETAANNGDTTAINVLRWGANSLANLITTLCTANDIKNPTIVLSGSVIKKTKILKRFFYDTISSTLNPTILEEDFEPTTGVLYTNLFTDV